MFGFLNLNAQSYNYSYSDPCTGNVKTIVVPINGNVTVSYYGEIGSFSQNDFNNGTFDAWTNNIFSQYGTNSPCSEIVGLGTAVNVTQNTALNVLGILNSLSAISDLASGSTNLIGGSVTTINNTGGGNSNNNKKGNNSQNGSGGNTTNYNNGTTTNTNNTTTNNNQNQTNGTSNSNEGSTTTSGSNETSSNGGNGTTSQNAGTQNPTQAGGTTTQSGSNENGNTSSNTTVSGEGSNTGTSETTGGSTETPINNQTTTENGGNGNNGGSGTTGSSGNNGSNGSGSGNNETQEGQTTTEGTEEAGGQTNITGGASTTVKSSPTSKEGGKPTIVASGDFVGFNFRNSEVNTGLKVTGGYTAMRWDGKRSSGILGDYTSALRGPNITAFYAFIRSKSIVIGSGTLTIGFEGNKSLYGTIAVGQMFSFKKPKSLKLLYMGTVSYGQVYRESFLGTALIAGATYDLKIGKRLDIKLMNLLVYAPYVSYYNDVVLKSPYVMLPSIGTNIRLTKKFKFNINAGGAWDLKTSALNYTVTCGARMLVGQ